MKGPVSEEFPVAARELAERCIVACRTATGMILDYSEESLAVLDHWVSQAGDKPEMVDLVAPLAGAYFGELTRRRFGAAWVMRGLEPASWRVELASFGLTWSPVAMAAEAVAGAEVDGYDATLQAGAREALVAERLAQLPPVPEDEFYSLTGRLEALEVVVDFLADLERQDREDAEADAEVDDDAN